jgi:hypothetical protein
MRASVINMVEHKCPFPYPHGIRPLKGKFAKFRFRKCRPIFCEILGLCEKQFNSDENYKMLFTPSLDELCSFRFQCIFVEKIYKY